MIVGQFQVADAQKEVQRLLGRCLLRLQQYEMLMKSMVANHELGGPVHDLEEQRAQRIQKISVNTLGAVAKALFETCVVPDGFERDLLENAPDDQISMSFSFRLVMPPELLAETKATIQELVVLRNNLVHHFLEQFDLRSESGCKAAAQHLDECYVRIDKHHLELVSWARTMNEVREIAAAHVQSDEFHNLLVNGIAPDDHVHWSDAGIIRVLKEAHGELSVDGWAMLDEARDWIEQAHPAQRPEKYFCRSWPHVLSASKAFDLEYRQEQGGRKTAWFRIRPGLGT